MITNVKDGERKKNIVHIIMRDKFTNDYISFMNYELKEYQHFFFTLKGDFAVDKNIEGLVEFDNIISVFYENKYKNLLVNADIIVISGVWFQVKFILLFIINRMIKRVYFHFWGDDFYRFRNVSKNIKDNIEKHIYFNAFSKAAGLIFLIEGEYEVFNRITKVNNDHFVAPMPSDPSKQIDYKKYRGVNKEKKYPLKVIVGNSATDTNCHEAVFEMLKHFSNKDVEIYCPLSYGDKTYAEKVAAEGKKLFGGSFVPVMEYMDKEKYFNFLSCMDIGIFFNDRQQALGNIYALLGMGKKIFLRKDTSMWEGLKKKGYQVYLAEDIKNMSFEEFCEYNERDKKKNLYVSDNLYGKETDRIAWNTIFSQ